MGTLGRRQLMRIISMRIVSGPGLACIFMLILAFPLTAAGELDAVGQQGQAVLDMHRDAVVTMTMVIGLSFGGDEMEEETEANATVIDPSGLAVLALSAVDPTSLFEAMGGDVGQVLSRIKDIKMILGDGSEISAEVVLRDRDL